MSLAVTDPLKNNLEETVTREFLLATGNPYKVLRAGLPPEPDQLCEHRKTGRQVGMKLSQFTTIRITQNLCGCRPEKRTPCHTQ